MLTKLGMMALSATIGTAALSTPAAADEHDGRAQYARGGDHGDARFDNRADNRGENRYDNRYDNRAPVVVAGRYDQVDGRFGVRDGEFGRRRAYEQMMRERRERAMMHARWLHTHRDGRW